METKKDVIILIITMFAMIFIIAYLMTIPKFARIIDGLAALWLIYMILYHFYNEMRRKNTNGG